MTCATIGAWKNNCCLGSIDLIYLADIHSLHLPFFENTLRNKDNSLDSRFELDTHFLCPVNCLQNRNL